MENQTRYDVQPEEYATVIRGLIGGEDNVTNHRLTWWLIVQGLLVNALVNVKDVRGAKGLALAGILVSLSAFVALYKSYQARGYLNFLGKLAKQGKLQEQHLPFDGWPRKRIKDWRRGVWICPWIQKGADLVEPYLALPAILVSTWTFLLLRELIHLDAAVVLGLAVLLSLTILFLFCIAWVSSQDRDEIELRSADPVPGQPWRDNS